MSTPSFIGVLCKEGIIKFVYCHSDGYPSYLGKMLLEHYNTPELATALVDLGSLSMVRERLAPDEGETHRFDTPVRHGPKGGVTTAYHRDRGDDLEIDSVVVDTPVVLKNAETLFLNILKEENITYGYLYNVADKLWYATDTVQDNRFFVLDENFIDAHTKQIGRFIMTDNIITARLFIDMDGTLAAWQQAACFEDLLQENYFRDLPPYQTVVDAVRILCNAHPELDIYALSAFMPENPAAVGEKYGWLDVYVPEIDAAHRIFVPCGESKAAAAANRLKMPCIDKSFVLLDDYSVNLHDWKEKGGSGIKLRNGINGSIGTWKGPSVSRFNTPETLATLICQAAKIRANATKEIIEMLRAKYPNGTRVRLVKMDDVQAPPIGTEGTVVGVDSIGNLLMHWDNGSGLNVVYGADEVERI